MYLKKVISNQQLTSFLDGQFFQSKYNPLLKRQIHSSELGVQRTVNHLDKVRVLFTHSNVPTPIIFYF